jgi:hypothetical protein
VFLPSRFHETFGLFLIEEYAKGVPKEQMRFGSVAGLFMPRREASQLAGRKAITSEKGRNLRGAPGMITCLGEDVRHVYVFDASISSTDSYRFA